MEPYSNPIRASSEAKRSILFTFRKSPIHAGNLSSWLSLCDKEYSNDSELETASNVSQPDKAAHWAHLEPLSTCVDYDGQIDSNDLLACKGPAYNEKVCCVHCNIILLTNIY